MTRTEFRLIKKALQAYYPRASLFPDKESMDLWYQNLADIPYPLVSTAITVWSMKSPFVPSLAEIRQHAKKIRHWITCQKVIRHDMGTPVEVLPDLTPEKQLAENCRLYLNANI